MGKPDIQVEITNGWCIALFSKKESLSAPQMFWDRINKCFNGIISFNSIFDIESEALDILSGYANSPYLECRVCRIEHFFSGMNRNIAIKVIDDNKVYEM